MSRLYQGKNYVIKNNKRAIFFFEKLGFPSGHFSQVLSTHVNALLNTRGGMLVFGVSSSGKIVGCKVHGREQEDLYKLALDNEIRSTRPIVSPSLCRFAVHPLTNAPLFVLEIKIGAGAVGEMYMNSSEKVYVMRRGKLFGPLIPQEIKELAIAKYKEEISSSFNLLTPAKPEEKERLEQEGEDDYDIKVI